MLLSLHNSLCAGGVGPHRHHWPQQGAGARGGRGRGPRQDVHQGRGLGGRHHHRQGGQVRGLWRYFNTLFTPTHTIALGQKQIRQ